VTVLAGIKPVLIAVCAVVKMQDLDVEIMSSFVGLRMHAMPISWACSKEVG